MMIGGYSYLTFDLGNVIQIYFVYFINPCCTKVPVQEQLYLDSLILVNITLPKTIQRVIITIVMIYPSLQLSGQFKSI